MAVVNLLANHPQGRRILIGAASDESALGAVEALGGAGRTNHAVVVGHDGVHEALEHIAKPNSPYLGTVAFFPERYGKALVDLVLRLGSGEAFAPSQYIDHTLIGRHNVQQYLGRPRLG